MSTNDTDIDAETRHAKNVAGRSSQHPEKVPSTKETRRSLSMHEGIAVWCDCCSCEAEPYWVEDAEAMGIDLGSDYEDPDR